MPATHGVHALSDVVLQAEDRYAPALQLPLHDEHVPALEVLE